MLFSRHPMRLPAVRVWGKEIRKGPVGREATVEISDGYRPEPFFRSCPAGQLGSLQIRVERKVKLGDERVILSAWVRMPVNAELSSENHRLGVFQSQILQRWIRIRLFRIMKEAFHGAH